ncbi:hypothetical protein [Leifsonia xyli]
MTLEKVPPAYTAVLVTASARTWLSMTGRKEAMGWPVAVLIATIR